MLRKILVCTDLSPASDALIQCIGELKTLGMEEAILTHVIYVANTPGLEEMLMQEARPVLERQKESLEAQGVKVRVEMPTGLPAHTLNETADKYDVSAVLVGSHGRGILKTVLLGSVSSKLLHESRRPVLLARIALLEGGKCQLVCRKMFSKVLFATDFSETSTKAFQYLANVVEETRSPVTMMHVHDVRTIDLASPARIEEFDDFAAKLLEPQIAKLRQNGSAGVDFIVTYGSPGSEIVAKAKKEDFSIIIMGSQGKGVGGELMMGSVAKEVARHAEVPVLFIPAT